MRIGFDHDKYTAMQSEHIRERIGQFGGKLYLELGGKLFDDNHASRVLPGFRPDSKMSMLLNLKDQAELVIAINADDIEKSKLRGDLGITYDADVLRLIDSFRNIGLYVGSVVITRWQDQHAAVSFKTRLENLGLKVYRHYPIEGYPYNIKLIVSENGFGAGAAAAAYVRAPHERRLVQVTAGTGIVTCVPQRIDLNAPLERVTFYLRSDGTYRDRRLAVESGGTTLIEKHLRAVNPAETLRIEADLSSVTQDVEVRLL